MERSKGLPAWLLSVVLHASIFIAIGLMAPATRAPSGADVERSVGIALVDRTTSGKTEYFTDGGASGNPANSSTSSSKSGLPGLPSLNDVSADLAVQLPTGSDGQGAASASVGLPNAGTLTGGLGGGSGTGPVGGQTRTQVFGARGNGSEFVYVFDRSSSMGGFEGRPLRAAKAELTNSLRDLVSVNQFQIIFYNERASVFNPFRPNPPKLFFATEENKHLAREYVQSMTASGGTNHKEALQLALRMSPDVIFFLTDAAEPELSAGELEDLKRRNRSEAMINTIEFGSGPATGDENFLIRLARQNRGQHVYVDVTNLSRGP